MANHPNRSSYRYLKVSQGFANTVLYLRVPVSMVAEADAAFADYEDNGSGRWAGWTDDKAARMPGVAVDWADRAYAGIL